MKMDIAFDPLAIGFFGTGAVMACAKGFADPIEQPGWLGVGGRCCGNSLFVWPGRHRPTRGVRCHPIPYRRKTNYGERPMRRGRRLESLHFHGFPFETDQREHSVTDGVASSSRMVGSGNQNFLQGFKVFVNRLSNDGGPMRDLAPSPGEPGDAGWSPDNRNGSAFPLSGGIASLSRSILIR